MLYGFLMTLFTINCFLLILIILIQQGKSSMGLGAMGGSTQMLFGGSGGQDIFQKTTWFMGAIFMIGSLLLALHKSRGSSQYLSYYAKNQKSEQRAPAPVAPEAPTATEEEAA
jgi:preprotein translocase subunit SecG